MYGAEPKACPVPAGPAGPARQGDKGDIGAMLIIDVIQENQ